MSVLKVVEIMASSPDSWEDATRNAVERSSKTIKNIKSVWVQDQSAIVSKSGKIKEFRVTCKITFQVGD